MGNHLFIRIFHVLPCSSVEEYVLRTDTQFESRGSKCFYINHICSFLGMMVRRCNVHFLQTLSSTLTKGSGNFFLFLFGFLLCLSCAACVTDVRVAMVISDRGRTRSLLGGMHGLY